MRAVKASPVDVVGVSGIVEERERDRSTDRTTDTPIRLSVTRHRRDRKAKYSRLDNEHTSFTKHRTPTVFNRRFQNMVFSSK